MSAVLSIVAPVLSTRADRPIGGHGGRALRACCTALVMVLALPCATTAAEFVFAQPAASPSR